MGRRIFFIFLSILLCSPSYAARTSRYDTWKKHLSKFNSSHGEECIAPSQSDVLLEPQAQLAELALEINPFQIFERLSTNLISVGFQELYQKNKIAALKFYLHSTRTFKGFSESDLEVNPIEKAGGRSNQGIFQIKTKRPEKEFILKSIDYGSNHIGKSLRLRNRRSSYSGGCLEVDRLWGLNSSGIAQPVFFLQQQQKMGLKKTITLENLNHLPKIAKIVESGHDGKTCFAVLEKAPGDRFDSVISKVESGDLADHQIRSLFESVGKQIGSMHYYLSSNEYRNAKDIDTFTHNDLVPQNIFFDSATQRITLVDNGGFDSHGSIWSDINNLFGESVYLAIANDSGNLYDLYGLPQPVHNAGISWNDEKDALLKLLSQPIPDSQYQTPKISKISRLFKGYLSFAKGYLEPYDDLLKIEIKDHFSTMCLQHAHLFLSNHIAKSSEELARAVAEKFPDLQACIQKKF